jgi:hypothetical protein
MEDTRGTRVIKFFHSLPVSHSGELERDILRHLEHPTWRALPNAMPTHRIDGHTLISV